MWWIFGLINVVIIVGFGFFYRKKIKDVSVWYLDDKYSFYTLLIFEFLGSFVGTLCLAGLLIYLLIDFIIYIIKKDL